MTTEYEFRAIERRWLARWQELGTYRADDDSPRPRFYALTMFPYPSGEGLHVGHGRNYVYADVQARYRKMQGFEVLYPMAWDAFGLPAENYAIQTGTQPSRSTRRSIANMKEQLGKLGCVYDWSREFATCDVDYYRWTQWLFLRLFHAGLAYRKEQDVNWCPGCQTVLANEQVVDGRCERSDDPVERRRLEQWFFRITDYADRLLDDLDALTGWPERVATMQRNWIGRSRGLELELPLADDESTRIAVFTTRPDTIFGVTFVALAPEHPLVERLGSGQAQVQAYVRAAGRLTDVERMAQGEKTGVPLGVDLVNPVNGERIPVWVADYVLTGYGTGAVMGVPAHDERDLEFAESFGLPVRAVLAGGVGDTGDSPMVCSDGFDGLAGAEARDAVSLWFEERGLGRRAVHYRLRDWLVSRQRYWGAPIPIVYCDGCGIVPVPESELPVLLPDDVEFRPSGQSPLTDEPGFLHTTCPSCGGPARRETDTLDTFVDSSWYYLRFCDPHDLSQPWTKARAARWLPVDQYMGGVEHAVLHLLYSRFITKVLYDQQLIEFEEPFTRLFNQGAIYRNGARMSKSRGNAIAVDDIVESHGSDAMRVFQLHIGPPEQAAEWTERGIEGASRFLRRVWRLALGLVGETVERAPTSEDEAIRRDLHRLTKKVTADIEGFAYNTAVAAMMEHVNDVYRWLQSEDGGASATLDEVVDTLLLLLAPLAPHISAELWERRGNDGLVHEALWPSSDESLARPDTVRLVVQINGKVRDQFDIDPTHDEDALTSLALGRPRVQEYLNGRPPSRVIVVPPSLVSLVT